MGAYDNLPVLGQANWAAQNEQCVERDPKSAKCGACERTGLPILLVRRTRMTAKLEKADFEYDDPLFEKVGVGGMPSQTCHGVDGVSEGVRLLRKGYVYVYLMDDKDNMTIECYESTAQGYLRRRALDAAQDGEPEELPKACIDAGHGVSAAFLFVDKEKYRVAWVAFAHDLWPERVRERYRKMYKEDVRTFEQRFRMVVLRDRAFPRPFNYPEDIGQTRFINNTDGVRWGEKQLTDIPEFNLDYSLYEGSIKSRFGFYTRARQVDKLQEAIRNYMALPQFKEDLKDGVPVVELDDPIGDVLEANFWRTDLCAELNMWMSEKTRAYKRWTSMELGKVRTYLIEMEVEKQHAENMKAARNCFGIPAGERSPQVEREAALAQPVKNLTAEEMKDLTPEKRAQREAKIKFQADEKIKTRQRVYSGESVDYTLSGLGKSSLSLLSKRMEEFFKKGEKATFDLAYVQWYNKYVKTIQKVSRLYVSLIHERMFSEIVTQYDYADLEADAVEEDVKSAVAYTLMIATCLEGGPQDLTMYKEYTESELQKDLDKAWEEIPLRYGEDITIKLWFDLKRDLADAKSDTEKRLSTLYTKAVTTRCDQIGDAWDEVSKKVAQLQEDAKKRFAQRPDKRDVTVVVKHNEEEVVKQLAAFWDFSMKVKDTYGKSKETWGAIQEMRGKSIDLLFSSDLSASMQMLNFKNPPYQLNLNTNRTTNMMLVGSKGVAPIQFDLNMTDIDVKDIGSRARRLFMRMSRASSPTGQHHASFNSNANSFHTNGVIPNDIDVNAVYGVRINTDMFPEHIQKAGSFKEFQELAYEYAMDPKNAHLFERIQLSPDDFTNGRFDPDVFAEKFLVAPYSDDQLKIAAQHELERQNAITGAKVAIGLELVNVAITIYTLNSVCKSLETAISRERDYLLHDYFMGVSSLLGSVLTIGENGMRIYTGGIDRQVLTVFSSKGIVQFLSRWGNVLLAVTSAASAYQMTLKNTEAYQRNELPIVNKFYTAAACVYGFAATMGAISVIFPAVAPITGAAAFFALIAASYLEAQAAKHKKVVIEKWVERCYFGRLDAIDENQVFEITKEAFESGETGGAKWQRYFTKKWRHTVFEQMAKDYINAVYFDMNPDLLPYMKVESFTGKRRSDVPELVTRDFYSIVDMSIDLPKYHPELSAYSALVFVQLTNKNAENSALHVQLAELKYGLDGGVLQPVDSVSPLVTLGPRPEQKHKTAWVTGWAELMCSPENGKDAPNAISTVVDDTSIKSGIYRTEIIEPTNSDEWGRMEKVSDATSPYSGISTKDPINQSIKGNWILDLDAESFVYVGLRLRYWPRKEEHDGYIDLEIHESMAFDPKTGECNT